MLYEVITLIEKILRNESVRKELQSVRKEARAKARKVAFKIPQLKDCKHVITSYSIHYTKLYEKSFLVYPTDVE